MPSQPWKRHLETTRREHPHLSESRSMASMARRWFIAIPSNALEKGHSFRGGRSVEGRSHPFEGLKASPQAPSVDHKCWPMNQGWADDCPTMHVMIRIHWIRQVQDKCERRIMRMDGNGDGPDGRTPPRGPCSQEWMDLRTSFSTGARPQHAWHDLPPANSHAYLGTRTNVQLAEPTVRIAGADSTAIGDVALRAPPPSVLLSRHHR